MFANRINKFLKIPSSDQSKSTIVPLWGDSVGLPFRNVVEQIDFLSTSDPTALALSVMGEGLLSSSEETSRVLTAPSGSSLYDSCIRMHVIATLSEEVIRRKEYPSVKMGIIYGVGGAVHYWAQNSPDLFGNNRVGLWKCTACSKITHFGKPATTNCPHCDALPEALQYREYAVSLSNGGIVLLTGHVDLLLELPNGWVVPVELKTISSKEFVKLKGPMIKHEFQLMSYLYVLSKDPFLKSTGISFNFDLGFVAYISKEDVGTGNFPIKMYKVIPKPVQMDRIKTRITAYAQGIAKSDFSSLPLKEECERSSFSSYVSKSCPVLSSCRELTFTPNL